MGRETRAVFDEVVAFGTEHGIHQRMNADHFDGSEAHAHDFGSGVLNGV